MRPSPDIRYDVASVLSRGARDYQEDALTTDFPIGSDVAFAVLSDGMGGHAAGDVASKIVVTEVYRELKFLCGTGDQFEDRIGEILREAAEGAVLKADKNGAFGDAHGVESGHRGKLDLGS